MDAEEVPHEFIYIEAGFNLTTGRRRGRNIGHGAIVNVSGQRGGNITLCAAITQNGVFHRRANLGPYNTELILTFLDRLHNIIPAANQRNQMQYIAITCFLQACDQIEPASIQGWIRHSKRFFPRCLANENIACDVDEALWPDPAWRRCLVFFFFSVLNWICNVTVLL